MISDSRDAAKKLRGVRFAFSITALMTLAAPQTFAERETQTLSLEAEYEFKEILPKSCDLSGSFRQEKYIDNIPRPLASEGDFLFACASGLIWRTTSPITESVIFLNNGRIYLESNAELKKSNSVVMKTLSRLLLNMLSGDASYFYHHFTLSRGVTDDITVELTPKTKAFKRALKAIGLKTKESGIDLNILDNSGQSTLIEITSFIGNHDMSSADRCATQYASSTEACDILFAPQ